MKKQNHFCQFWGTFALLFLLGFTSCVTSYNIHTFSDNVETLQYTTTEKINNETGNVTTVTKYEGLFKAKDYETAMQMAKEAGFTRVLSIEYGTSHILGFIGSKWVVIRCTKEAP